VTSIGIASHPLSENDHRAQLHRAVIASTVGTIIEWYDFLLCGTTTALVFGKLFFPKSDPLVGVLEAFAVYSVGFIARPGAMIFGHYGDRIGRKGRWSRRFCCPAWRPSPSASSRPTTKSASGAPSS
jgi:hypothetical protein